MLTSRKATIGNRTRPFRNCRMLARLFGGRFRRRLVEPDAHLLTGLEHRDHFFRYRHGLAGAWVARCARVAALDRERSEAAQFYPIAAGEGIRDSVEDRVHNVHDSARSLNL